MNASTSPRAFAGATLSVSLRRSSRSTAPRSSEAQPATAITAKPAAATLPSNEANQNSGRIELPSWAGFTVTFWSFFSSGRLTITSPSETRTLIGLSR